MAVAIVTSSTVCEGSQLLRFTKVDELLTRFNQSGSVCSKDCVLSEMHLCPMLLWLYKSKSLNQYLNHFVVQPHLCRNQPVWNHFKSNEFTSCRSHAAVPNHCFPYCHGSTKHTLLYPALLTLIKTTVLNIAIIMFYTVRR